MLDDDLYKKKTSLWVKLILLLLFITGLLVGFALNEGYEKEKSLQDNILEAFNSPILVISQSYGVIMYEEIKENTKIYALTTAYNTVSWQTDSTPCISASGHNICKMTNVVACPRSIELGTRVIIDGIYYTCLDRLATKYDNRFDISFNKDIQGALNYGKQWKEIEIVN
jgi:3D (Asp-Asp-Asp) domain-containing protein